ncbi:MAG: sigma 54-interacting transcriptional regulator [Thermodesulfobacteriota bacterium]
MILRSPTRVIVVNSYIEDGIMDRARILVVEDDPVVSAVLKNRLARLGYEVCGVVSTGEEAVRVVGEILPDLIIMDIILAGELDGIQTSEAIRAQLDIPVIFATSYSDDQVLERAKLSDPFGYIVKPYGERELRITIEMALYKHRMEQRLRKSEERFRRLAQCAPFGLSIMQEDGTIEYVNDAFTKLLGYQREETPCMRELLACIRPGDTYHDGMDRQWMAHWDGGLDEPQVHGRECAITSKDGHKKVMSIRTVSLDDGSCILSFHDVTLETMARDRLEELVEARTRELKERTIQLEAEIAQRLTAEAALRSSEERFRAVFASAGQSIFIKDTRHRYLQINPYMEKLVDMSSSTLKGRTDDLLFGPEAAAHIREVEERVLRGERIAEEHTRPIHGSPATFYDIRTPLIDGKGDIVGIIGLSRDVTELKGITVTRAADRPQFFAASTQVVMERALLAAERDCVVLLLGESGCGKDWFARFIHDHSPRAGGPFFSLNCAAIARELAESELFGHERGAFTGAGRRKRGLLELAEGGTLLLNEIGEMAPALQAKLLTFLDTMSFTRLGGEETVKVNARLLVATNRDLAKDVEHGKFRQDLYYRVNVFTLHVPPLRERVEDIPLITEKMLGQLLADLPTGRPARLDPAALDALVRYQWPGNVRELRNVLERALILTAGDVVTADALQIDPRHVGDWEWSVSFPPAASFNELLADLKASLIREALQRSGGKRIEAARMLGMTRDSLKKQMKTLSLGGAD